MASLTKKLCKGYACFYDLPCYLLSSMHIENANLIKSYELTLVKKFCIAHMLFNGGVYLECAHLAFLTT